MLKVYTNHNDGSRFWESPGYIRRVQLYTPPHMKEFDRSDSEEDESHGQRQTALTGSRRGNRTAPGLEPSPLGTRPS